jgi:hypothetical protein
VTDDSQGPDQWELVGPLAVAVESRLGGAYGATGDAEGTFVSWLKTNS